MNISIGSDHAGLDLKEKIKEFLVEAGHKLKDVGAYTAESVDYPDFARLVCGDIVSGVSERGILICGTGIGMSMAANKVKGIRCALCRTIFGARMTRAHNDANVLALGSRISGDEIAREIVRE